MPAGRGSNHLPAATDRPPPRGPPVFTQEESADCPYCDRRVLARRSTAGEQLCWAGAVGWAFFVALPLLVAGLNATDHRPGQPADPDAGFHLALGALVFMAFGVAPVIGLAVAGWWLR